MPIYDYRCKACNSIYEILHIGKENFEDIQCPKCGSSIHTKLMSVPAIITKGPISTPCEQGACGMDKLCSSECGLK